MKTLVQEGMVLQNEVLTRGKRLSMDFVPSPPSTLAAWQVTETRTCPLPDSTITQVPVGRVYHEER